MNGSPSIFRDPKLSDRELLLFLVYQIARTRADLLHLSRALVQKAGDAASRDTTLAAQADAEIFAQLEEDLRQFETRRQRPGQQ